MYRPREFKQVDVFASAPFLGNPLAAVVDGTDLPAELMQRFARWTNLSETVFLLPPSSPDAGYAVRIFTPFQELPFAGHPTLGAARAWLDSGGTPRARGRIRRRDPDQGDAGRNAPCAGAHRPGMRRRARADRLRRRGPRLPSARDAPQRSDRGGSARRDRRGAGGGRGTDPRPPVGGRRARMGRRRGLQRRRGPRTGTRLLRASGSDGRRRRRAAGGAPARRPTRSAPSPRGPAWPRTR